MIVRRFFIVSVAIASLVAASGCAKARSDHGASDGAESGKKAFGELSIAELEARMADAKAGKIELAIFDNNQHDRFDKSHIAGAKWVKFDDVKASDLPTNKDATLVFYCANEH
jgi:hypothetical protein